ncbi:MAG: BON domain-containing protein [Planctomycetota bacterium]
MRHFFMITLVTLATGLMPAMVRAENPNQEAAKQIRDHLRDSSQLVDYKIAVRYLDGTVWLQGHVRDQGQFDKAVALVLATQGVAVNQVIRDELTIDGAKPASPSNSPATKTIAGTAAANPLRATNEKAVAEVNRAHALPSSFNQAHAATPVVMMQAVPPPAIPPIPAPPVAGPAKLPAEVTTGVQGAPLPMYAPGAAAGGPAPVRYDHPAMPAYAWPSYAAHPNYAAVTYPKQYSPTAWPYIGPFYPYPQVPLGWRKVSLEWDNGWWWLDFNDKPRSCWWR